MKRRSYWVYSPTQTATSVIVLVRSIKILFRSNYHLLSNSCLRSTCLMFVGFTNRVGTVDAFIALALIYYIILLSIKEFFFRSGYPDRISLEDFRKTFSVLSSNKQDVKMSDILTNIDLDATQYRTGKSQVKFIKNIYNLLYYWKFNKLYFFSK